MAMSPSQKQTQEEIDMNKMTMLAIAVPVVVAAPVFALESAMTFGKGEAILISPDGTVHKSNSKVSAAKHNAARAQGAGEVSRGTVFYKHEGKLYGVSCVGPYIGGWKQGYPGTEKYC
jgi:hypothetical protein